jgi:hypothetical protein
MTINTTLSPKFLSRSGSVIATRVRGLRVEAEEIALRAEHF